MAPLPLAASDYDVPGILVVPMLDWPVPDEKVTITSDYPEFSDHYSTQDDAYINWWWVP